MTKILALETSTENASVTLLCDGQLFSRDLTGVQTHSHGLLPAVQAIMQEANLALITLDAIAFGCGPGAFTGVRTSCGVVQGLAFGLDLPVLSVVSLLPMAEAVRAKQACVDAVCVLDARMGEVYWAHYRYSGDRWYVVTEPQLSGLMSAISYAKEVGSLLVLGNGLQLPDDDRDLPHSFEMPHALQLASLAQHLFLDGGSIVPELAQPLYLRNKVALTTAERLAEREAK